MNTPTFLTAPRLWWTADRAFHIEHLPNGYYRLDKRASGLVSMHPTLDAAYREVRRVVRCETLELYS